MDKSHATYSKVKGFIKNKAVFLDRDGVINFDYGYIGTVDRFKIIPGVIHALRTLQSYDYLLIIITNQSGIGRKYYTEKDFELVNNHMTKLFMNNHVHITDVFHCPHLPEDQCFCRKPNPGMLKKAIEKYNIDVKKSLLFGDNEKDILAGKNAGIEKNILIGPSSKLFENCVTYPSVEEYVNSNRII
jgi:D-glycero-D-manno-heptose 1,7-bisphosphate phosphatase